MTRLYVFAFMCVLAAPALAQDTDRTAMLEEAQAFGALVGQAVQCAVPAETIQAFVQSALDQRLPKTGDAAFDEQLNQAFEQAMRSAEAPDDGCDAVSAAVTGG